MEIELETQEGKLEELTTQNEQLRAGVTRLEFKVASLKTDQEVRVSAQRSELATLEKAKSAELAKLEQSKSAELKKLEQTKSEELATLRSEVGALRDARDRTLKDANQFREETNRLNEALELARQEVKTLKEQRTTER